MLRIPTVLNRTRGGVGILQNDMPLGIRIIDTAQPEGQERVDEVISRGEDLEVRKGALGDGSAVRGRVRENTGRRDVDFYPNTSQFIFCLLVL